MSPSLDVGMTPGPVFSLAAQDELTSAACMMHGRPSSAPSSVVEPSNTGVFNSVVRPDQSDFLEHFRRLPYLRDLPGGWDSYGTEAPNKLAIQRAHVLLNALMDANLLPHAIAPSAEGGIGFVFRQGQLYADVECLNNGHVLAVISDGQGEPEVWEVQGSFFGFQNAIRRILEQFRAREARADVSARSTSGSRV
jgi:hypothetical protein